MEPIMKEVYEKNLVIAKREKVAFEKRKSILAKMDVKEFMSNGSQEFEKFTSYQETAKELALISIDKRLLNLNVEIDATQRKLDEAEEIEEQ